MLLPSSSSTTTLLLILLGHFTFLTNAQSQVTCMPGTSSNSLEACRNRIEHACCPGRFCFQSSPGVYEVCVNSGKPSYHHDQHTERAVRGEVRRDGLMRLSRCRFQVMLEMMVKSENRPFRAVQASLCCCAGEWWWR